MNVPSGPVGRWWEPAADKRVICTLCPRYCNIPDGSKGFCHIRRNHSGQLISIGYGRSTGFAVDPVEKKPLYHFFPGSKVLSFGTTGCNLGCKFCQNWYISKSGDGGLLDGVFTARDVVNLALKQNCTGIAYTYNDPIIFGEWVLDISTEARSNGLSNILVSNGYISPQARSEIYGSVDAINVDLKAFSEDFYRRLTLAHLEPVLDTLRWLVHETDVWVEITTLVIPGENDEARQIGELTEFISGELGTGIPLHFSAFHPDFKMRNHPATSLDSLETAAEIAQDNGIKHVYLGNIRAGSGQDTNCPECGLTLIKRNYYQITAMNIISRGCPECGSIIDGRFENRREKT